MGRSHCHLHGISGTTQTCLHVAELIDSGRFGEFYSIKGPLPLLICEECLKVYGLEDFRDHPYDKRKLNDKYREDYVYKFLEKCERIQDARYYNSCCITAAEVDRARKDGKPDPFPVFEKTITSLNPSLLDKLKENLEVNFEFRPLVCEPKNPEPAFLIEPGSYPDPLTVKIYYVSDNKIDTIIEVISTFLKNQALNQARVEFWKEGDWEKYSILGIEASGFVRGEVTLIREIYLNC